MAKSERAQRWFRAAVALAMVLGTGAEAQSTAALGTRYVSMGSSFAAGPGILPYATHAPGRCFRSQHNYAQQLASRRGFDLVDVACSGATTDAILKSWRELPPQIDAVTADTGLVTVTIGGNDIGYIGGLFAASCRQSGKSSCALDTPETEADYANLKVSMSRIVSEIRSRAPGAVIALIEYPVVLPPRGGCSATPLSEDAAEMARAKAVHLAQITAEVAQEGGAVLIDTDTFSRGHDACASAPWINGYIPGAAYHPNLAAMTAIAEALDRILTGRLRAVDTPTGRHQGLDLSPNLTWGAPGFEGWSRTLHEAQRLGGPHLPRILN